MPGYDRRSRSRSPARRDGGRFEERRDDRGYYRRDDRGGYGGGRDGGRQGGHRENNFGKPTFNRSRGPSRRTDFRIVVRNLPASGSWQDLKDHMREAGDVSFTDVIHEGDDNIGIVEFFNKDDMTYAVEKLDGSKFKSHEGDTCTIEVDEDKDEKYRDATSRDFEKRGGFNAGRARRDDRGDDRRRDSRSPPRRRSRSRDRDQGRRDRDRSRSPAYRGRD